MLAAVRRSVRSWAAGLILFLALVAIVITGFGTGGFGGLGSLSSGPKGDVLASVDGKQLTENEASDILNRQFGRARQEQPELSMSTFLQSAFEPIVDQLILALAVQSYGERQGLSVSDRMIDREIVNIPAFRNFAGQFDDATFRQALQGQGITEAQLRQDIARSLMQRQLLGPIARGTTVPEAVAREYANLLLERRQGTIGVVPAELMRAGVTATDAEVATFYQRNRARFTIPERRVVRYAMIGRDQVAAAIRATDPEIAAYYRQNAATYGPRQTRDLQSVVLPDQAAAQRFVQQVRSGTSFADAARAAGFSAADISVANQTQAQFAGTTGPAVARAAFAAAQGAVIGPVRSGLGYHIVRTERINQTPAQSLESVRPAIVQAIEQRKLGDALNALIERVEQRVADGANVEDAARAEHLNLVTTPPITATGQVPGQVFVLPPELQPVLRSAFELDPDDPEPVVEQLPNNNFALVGIERAIPAAPPPLAQIQAQVRDALIQQRALERARTIGQQIVARINGGMPIAQAFAQAGVRLPAPEAVNMQRLEISRAGQQVPPPLLTLFSLPQGRASLLAAPNNAGWFVIHHGHRTPGDAASQPQLIASTRSEFTTSGGTEMAEQFARSLEQVSGVERNAEAIRRTRDRLEGNVAQ